MKFNRNLKAYFNYSKSELNSIRIMIIIIVIVFCVPELVKSVAGSDVVATPSKIYMIKQDSLGNIRKNFKRPVKKYIDSIIELNTADTNLLKKVKGISPWYAKKIVRFRDRVGGFCEISQLRDVKLREGLYEKIYKQFTVDASLVKHFDVDTISFRNLLRNPYFDYKTVKKIFKIKNDYRGLTPEFLLEEHAIDTVLYFKTRSYFVEK